MSRKNNTRARFACHVEQVKKRLAERPLGFQSALSEKLIRDALAEAGVEFRQRVYTPWITLWAFMGALITDSAGRLMGDSVQGQALGGLMKIM